MRLALAQLDPTVGDLAGNAALIRAAVERAAAQGAELVVTPELAICGYPPEDLVLRPTFVAACEAAVAELAVGLPVPVLVGGPHRGATGVCNSAFLLRDGVIAARYDKMALPNYSVFDEQRTFVPGEGPLVVELAGERIGISICEDIWVADGPAHAAVEAGATLVVNLSASPYHLGKGEQRDALIAAFARDHGVAVGYANLVGGQDELAFDGRSLVYGADGALLARGVYCAEDLVVCDVPGGVGEIAPLPASRDAELWAALTLGLRDYVDKNGFKGVLFGLSGGIDSALVAALSVAISENMCAIAGSVRSFSQKSRVLR